MSTEHYLPEQFILEFDVMYENDDTYFRYTSDFRIGFSAMGDENYYNGGVYSFVINNTSQCSLGKTGTQNFSEDLQKPRQKVTPESVAEEKRLELERRKEQKRTKNRNNDRSKKICNVSGK